MGRFGKSTEFDHCIREIVDGSSAFLGPLGRRDNRGDALVAKWEGQGMGKKLWEASEGVLQEKGFDA